VTAGTLAASPWFSWGATRTGRPRKPATPAPHWKDVLRWSLEWPWGYDPDERPVYRGPYFGRWWVRVA
jgi:hypothetical protein